MLGVRGTTYMNRTVLATCLSLALSGPVLAQTKDPSLTLATALPSLNLPMIELENNLGGIKWDSVLPNLSGQMRATAENAKHAQAEFILAMRRYRAALEDTAYQARLCAR
jgi:hypothetical protein